MSMNDPVVSELFFKHISNFILSETTALKTRSTIGSNILFSQKWCQFSYFKTNLHKTKKHRRIGA